MIYKIILNNKEEYEIEADDYMLDNSMGFNYYIIFYKKIFFKTRIVARFKEKDVNFFYAKEKRNKENENKNKNEQLELEI